MDVAVEVYRDRLVLSGRGTTFPLAGARLGALVAPHTGAPLLGAVLHLGDATRGLRLACRGPVPPGARLDAPPTALAELWLSPLDFAALLAFLPALVPWPTRMVLGVNPVSGVVYEGALARVLVALGILSAPETVMNELALEIAGDELRLVRGASLVASAPWSAVAMTPGVETRITRGTYVIPVLLVTFPGQPTLPLEISDMRFAWLGPASAVPAAWYATSLRDALPLLDLAGLGARVRLEASAGP